jgi:hypothetical protein
MSRVLPDETLSLVFDECEWSGKTLGVYSELAASKSWPRRELARAKVQPLHAASTSSLQ